MEHAPAPVQRPPRPFIAYASPIFLIRLAHLFHTPSSSRLCEPVLCLVEPLCQRLLALELGEGGLAVHSDRRRTGPLGLRVETNYRPPCLYTFSCACI